jgi:HEAT repeat protein
MNRPVNRLIRSLKDATSEYESNRAVLGLKKLGSPAVDALILELKRQDSHFRVDAAYALGEMGTLARPAIPALIDMLEDRDGLVRYSVVYALKGIGRHAVPDLSASLADSRPMVRNGSATALGELGPIAFEATPKLRLTLHDKDPATRVAAARALWRITREPDSAVLTVSMLLHDKNVPDTLVGSCATLAGELEGHAEKLVPILCKKFPEVGTAAAKSAIVGALWQIGSQSDAAVAVIIAALQDKNTRHLSCLAIENQLSWSPQQRQRVLTELEKLLSDEDELIRRAAVRAFGAHINGVQSVPVSFIARLNDTDSDTKAAAALAIGDLRDVARSFIPELSRLLSDRDFAVQICAAIALSKIGGDVDRCVQILQEGATSEDLDLNLVCSSIDALGEIGGPAYPTVRTLEDLRWNSTRSRIRAHAEGAIWSIRSASVDPERTPDTQSSETNR